MRIVQCLLRNGKFSVLCWLREEERLKIGTVVRLEGEDGDWSVEHVGYHHELHTLQTIL